MAPQVAQNLARIKHSSKELNDLADEATEHIRALGRFLDDTAPGIEVEDDDIIHTSRTKNALGVLSPSRCCLGYSRDDGGKFGLVVVTEAVSTDDEGKRLVDDYGDPVFERVSCQRLDQSTRTIRIAALGRLPGFIELLSGELEKTTAEARKNLEKVKSAAAELRSALSSTRVVYVDLDWHDDDENEQSIEFETSTLADAVERIKSQQPDAKVLDYEAAEKYVRHHNRDYVDFGLKEEERPYHRMVFIGEKWAGFVKIADTDGLSGK